MKKTDLRAQILDRLAAYLRLQTAAARLARDEAISEESRPENKYDTHSQEAAYLAEGQARLAADLEASIALYQSLPLPEPAGDAAIAIGMLVELTARNQASWYFLGPRAGGLELNLDGHDILLVTPQSPLGRLLIGRRLGDSVLPPGRGTPVAHRITRIL